MSNRINATDTCYTGDCEPNATCETIETNDSTGTTYDLTTCCGTSEIGADATGLSYAADGYDSGYGTTTYDLDTGAYDQHLDYRTADSQRHHRERLDSTGTYRHRDVDSRDDGTTHVHREYMNPNTGTSYHRDYER
ncbi:hypothetical protein N7520_004045 [Penicillium odoratum]|uniref:uncharacterized protein n=1 Tax=Penicillium odoratum TaxID=1167516 RepID=UPI00254833BF|nr:uncharacterized protein N7520_004045 [Penicillium odoratum]KAJ5769486.1 hypothetical protein N7520_004045 [Penicillium odoratum]